MNNKLGLYLHIPFCKSKCAYCDFFSGKATQSDYDGYVGELSDKIKYWSQKTDRALTSIYIGGGTPSVLGTERLCAVMNSVYDCFSVADFAEVTVEVNPESGKELDFSWLKKAGVNRISIGMQSADEEELKILGRIHSTDDVRQTVFKAKDSGIDNISLDLMLGIPLQTFDSLGQSVDFCAGLGVKHISAYLLKIEEGTGFYKNRDRLALPDEDAQAEMYLFAVDRLERLGYHQYEVSNFAKSGFESRHNSSYWTLDDYIGIGPSAHSFFGGRRFYYKRDMQAFFDNVTVDDGAGGDEKEYIMLSLRLKRGLVFDEFEKKYSKPLPDTLLKKSEKYISMGLMKNNGSSLFFTPEGFLVSNTVICDLT